MSIQILRKCAAATQLMQYKWILLCHPLQLTFPEFLVRSRFQSQHKGIIGFGTDVLHPITSIHFQYSGDELNTENTEMKLLKMCGIE